MTINFVRALGMSPLLFSCASSAPASFLMHRHYSDSERYARKLRVSLGTRRTASPCHSSPRDSNYWVSSRSSESHTCLLVWASPAGTTQVALLAHSQEAFQANSWLLSFVLSQEPWKDIVWHPRPKRTFHIRYLYNLIPITPYWSETVVFGISLFFCLVLIFFFDFITQGSFFFFFILSFLFFEKVFSVAL